VKWSDIGGQEEAKLRLQQCVEWPLRYPDTLRRFNLSTPSRGVLLYGPPGCSKTTLGEHTPHPFHSYRTRVRRDVSIAVP
jgi:SpoVK/Ycf46/Vps4 family AAA+-type ATPase